MSKHNCLYMLFIMLTTTCFGPCGPSSGHKKCIMRKTMECVIISKGTYSKLLTRSRCFLVFPYWSISPIWNLYSVWSLVEVHILNIQRDLIVVWFFHIGLLVQCGNYTMYDH